MVIRSRDNQLVKLIRSLRLHVHREAERAFVVEGYRAVADAIDAGGVARIVAVRDHQSVPDWITDAQLRIFEAPVFDFMAQTSTPQGILGVFESPRIPIPVRPNPLYLVLDAISDPGNLGTIVRTSAAAGVDALFLGPGCVDWLNDKVVRAAMGAHFRISISHLDEVSRELIVARCPLRVISDGYAKANYDEVDWDSGAALIVGSEARGVSFDMERLANASVAIPMSSGVESLNAAVAAGVILFEAQRQRRH